MLTIGETTAGEPFALPAEAVTETFAILAKRRAGKSYTAARFVEELLKTGQQVVVVDPKGDWWGLRSSADGKGPGYPIVILGGGHGDLPLEPTSGELIAQFAVEQRVSLLLDLSEFRKHQVATFMTAFLETLYRLKAREEYRTPMMLVIDEADAVAPQRPMKGEERMLGAAEDIVRCGGQRGIGCMMVTQRSAVLNKNVLTQIQMLLCLRTIAPQDLAALDAWIDVHGTREQRDELLSSLPSLPIGTAWVWSPGWPTEEGIFERVKIDRRETFDSGATPRPGQEIAPPKTLADVDLTVLRERLAATLERAKADDPAELHRQIVMLTEQRDEALQLARRAANAAELSNKLAAMPKVEKVVERVEVPALDDRQMERLAELADRLASVALQIVDVANDIKLDLKRGQLSATPMPQTVTTIPKPTTTLSAAASVHGTASLRAGERRMLQVLALHRERSLTRQQLATLSGFTVTGGTFSTYLGTLRRYGYVSEDAGVLLITDKGLGYLGTDIPPSPQTTEDILSLWREALRAGERKMLDELIAVYPRSLTRAMLADLTGFAASGGTFSTYLGTLRRNGLIEVQGDHVQASATLFLTARQSGV